MNENLTAMVGKLAAAIPSPSWTSWASAVMGGAYPFITYYLSMAKGADERRSCASRTTLEKRVRYHNRKGRSAARRLGFRWVRLRVSDVEFGEPCPFCALPRPKDESLVRACRSPGMLVTGSALCPREGLGFCPACGSFFARERGHLCAAQKVPA